MSYPGNPNLADDVQRRVLSTFESMLREVVQGNHQEALLGCSLVERLDPAFAPVAELRTRLEAAGGGGVDVNDLAQTLGIELPEVDPDAIGSIASVARKAVASAAEEPITGEDATPATEPTPQPADEPLEPSALGDERIETVETEAFEDSGEQIDVMSDEEMRKAMMQADAEAASGDPIAHADAATEEPVAASGAQEPDAAEPAPDQPIPDETAAEQAAAPAEPEGDHRVAALLSEGQAAFDAGEYQTAIDSWSRVFLIDLDHAEASSRIEEARKLLAEREREAEELFHASLEKLEAGDTTAARESLEATLERQPGHIGAREHLDRLQAGVTPGEAGVEAADLTAEPTDAIPPPAPVAAGASAADLEFDSLVGDVESSGKKFYGLSTRFLGIAALGTVLVLGGIWYMFSRRDDVFPNASVGEADTVHAVERAQQQHGRGSLEAAIASLERVPATDERHSEALALLERWRQEADVALAGDRAAEAEANAELASARAGLISQARTAIDNGLPHRAIAPLVLAAQTEPLSGEEEVLQKMAEDALRPYNDAWLAYKDGDYRSAVRPLWQRVRENSNDFIARDLLIATQFNLARSSLLGGDPSEAAALLSEAAKLAPGDGQIAQALRFAEHYVGQQQDLRYRIFIRHLPVR